jgi:hypothetical protein
MRSLLIRGAFAIIAIAAVWLVTARWCSLLVDQVATVHLGNLPATPVGWNGVYLQFGEGVEGLIGPKGSDGADLLSGGHILDLTGPGPDYQQVAANSVDASGRLVIAGGARSFTLGSLAGSLTGADGPIPAFAADPGDATSLVLERSWLSWPTPMDLNFVTGRGSSWRRHLYYRLTWKKKSGAELAMLWRFEQGYDSINGWKAAGNGDGATGLIRLDIRPAP